MGIRPEDIYRDTSCKSEWGSSPGKSNILLRPRRDWPRLGPVRTISLSISDRGHSRTPARKQEADTGHRFRPGRLRPSDKPLNERDRAGNNPRPFHIRYSLLERFPTHALKRKAPIC